MEKNNCDCSQCEHWESCEIKMVISNPIRYGEMPFNGDPMIVQKEMIYTNPPFQIKKGDKIGQLILKRHEGYLMPIEYTKDEERNGGFGSTGT